MDAEYWELVRVIKPVVRGTEHWDKRYDVIWYVELCVMRGFANTDAEKQNCAKRYMAGKRKVSAPGTKRKKRKAKEMQKMLKNVPFELNAAVIEACKSNLAAQVLGGNAKAMNALIGSVLKVHKVPPAVVKHLIEAELGKTPRK